jgi:arginine decarboxylase
MSSLSIEELTAAIQSGAIDTVVVAMTDMQGRLTGKRIHGDHFLNEVLKHGTEGCNYLLAVDVDMNTVQGYEMSSWERGYSDFELAPDFNTLRLIPWQEGAALVLADVQWLDHSPVVASPRQILRKQIANLEKAGMQNQLSMLHFHIGSQITAIKRFKNALKEAAIVYAKVIKMGFKPKYLNIGGGVGVDYDGSRTTATSSANYNLQEFANDAVYVISEVCKAEGVKMPDIVTESGRVIAAYHSVVVTDIREIQGEETLDTIEGFDIEKEVVNAQRATRELKYILDNVSRKNYAEYYHDAVEFNEELQTLFNLGYIPLKERAVAEHMFHLICRRALYFSSFEKGDGDEFESLQRLKVSKYLANFSIFQSIPDSWSIDQLFPVMPLSRHDEKPTLKGTIVDITCDSDGCLERFIDSTDLKNFLDLHTMSSAPYYLGFFLTGAYQESLANEHNLFGAIHEIEVVFNEEGDWKISS